MKEQPAIPLKEIFTAASNDLLDVLESMLTLSPVKRCTCSEALQMSYFSNKPAPTPGDSLPRPNSGLDFSKSVKRQPSEVLAPMAKRLHFEYE